MKGVTKFTDNKIKYYSEKQAETFQKACAYMYNWRTDSYETLH